MNGANVAADEIYRKILATKDTESSISELIHEMKDKKTTVQKIFDALQNNPPPNLKEILRRLCQITGKGYPDLNAKLTRHLCNNDRNYLSGVRAATHQQQIWARLYQGVHAPPELLPQPGASEATGVPTN